VIGWTPIEDLTIEGGLLLIPNSRILGLSASGGQVQVEARSTSSSITWTAGTARSPWKRAASSSATGSAIAGESSRGSIRRR